jgi:hypothetical protein
MLFGRRDYTVHDMMPDVTATGPTTTATDRVGNSARRFYGVALVL